MSELQKFKDDLEAELVAAAGRQALASVQKPNLSRSVRSRPLLAVAAAAAFLVVASFGASVLLAPAPADASAITIEHAENESEIKILDVITDPAGVISKLENELGIRATMTAVPVPSELVGRITAVDTTGQVEHEFDGRGSVVMITIPNGFTGSLNIEYGRSAAPGEPYDSTTSDPACADVYGLSPSQTLDQLQDLGGSMRFESVSRGGDVKTRIELGSIPENYVLVDLAGLSSDSYLVTFAEDPSSEPIHPNCG